ncbi:hypothetical protein FA13DRAFT_1712965 [Coprinellus micaceus]|uniref:Uncharacterized protein n=1 Tax=Coprinellus micaceus TaxID=71717 RepID=A0A4Y7SY37_COPMI|nr:hypothetical protein FA13DRAFT_1712965 [Coprinellus micaceus]
MNPFGWQLDVGSELLTGGDVVLNAGSLMLEQASKAKLRAVAVCSETIEGMEQGTLVDKIVIDLPSCSLEMLETEMDINDEPVLPSRPLTPPEITQKEGVPKCTHVKVALDALKKKTLVAKLSWNTGVKEQNEACRIKHLKVLLTPATHSAAATIVSDAESYLTIVEAEVQTLEWINEKITLRLLKKKVKCEQENKRSHKAEKRKAEEEEEKAESKATKLRKSQYHAPPLTVVGSRSSCQEILYPFPDLLHQTASYSHLPMSIFTNKNLKIINESIGVIPRMKLNDESMLILNFNNPSKLMSCSLDISRDKTLDSNPHTWCKIHMNHHRFQLKRDPPGLEPENSDYWTQVYMFVLRLPNFNNKFLAIVVTELETRLNHMNIEWKFNQVKFENVWIYPKKQWKISREKLYVKYQSREQ